MKRSTLRGQVAIRVGLILLIGALAFAGYKTWRVSQLLADLTGHLQSLALLEGTDGSLALSGSDARTVAEAVDAVDRSISSLHVELGSLTAAGPLLAWLPVYGGDLAQSNQLLEYAAKVTSGTRLSLDAARLISADLDKGKAEGQALGSAAVVSIESHSAELDRARTALDGARAARELLDVTALSSKTRSYVQRVDRLFPLLTAAFEGMKLLPKLIGGEGPREYLLLVQNSDELRATGGFISSVVRVRLVDGDIQGVEFTDSYAVDNPDVKHPDAPAALRRYMDASYWVLRDANWSPDFPTTARDAAMLYTLDRGVPVDGVIASNLTIIPRLLEATGPVQVEGYDGTVDASNALSMLQAFYSSPEGKDQTGDWWDHRKDFAGKLFVALLERIRNGQVDQDRLLTILSSAILSRDLMIYLQDPEGQALVNKAGLSGALRDGPGDALMIVDSNVGWNKVDPNVARSAEYNLTIDPSGQARGRVSITYTNLSPETGALCVHEAKYPRYAELQQGCYWDFVRVVAAPNATAISSSVGEAGLPPEKSGTRTVLGGYLIVPRGQARQVNFEYTASGLIKNGDEYRLVVEKQPGAQPLPFHIEITLPSDWASFRADPAPSAVQGRTLVYDLTLQRDWGLVVRVEERGTAWAMGLGLAGIALISTGLIWLRNRSGETSAS